MIGSGSPPTYVISLSQSEVQKVRVDLLPRGSPPKSHVISQNQSESREGIRSRKHVIAKLIDR